MWKTIMLYSEYLAFILPGKGKKTINKQSKKIEASFDKACYSRSSSQLQFFILNSSFLISSVVQPVAVIDEGRRAGLVNMIIFCAPMELQIAAGKLHLHRAVGKPRQYRGNQ